MKRNISKKFVGVTALALCSWSYQAWATDVTDPATPALPAVPAIPGTPGTAATPATPAVPATSPTKIADTQTTIGPFTAEYYNGDTLVASEQVSRPAINYSYSNFHGIPSQDFSAVWTGVIDVGTEHKTLNINFDVSWSDVALYIDGKTVSSWSNNDQTIPYEFNPGVHKVRIEYHNNWHTTDFNTSFTTNTLYTKDEAMALVQPHIDLDTQVIYVGAYESGDLYNNSTVVLDGTADKVFLVLSSYDSFNWVIENPHNVTITGIAYGSYSNVSTVTADETIPTFEIDDFAYGYQDFTAPSSDIEYLTGRRPDYTYGEYSLSQAFISVPGSATDTTQGDNTQTQIGPFTAEYYNGDTLVATEQVSRPAINYIYSNFYGIPSYDFNAIWTGNIDVGTEPKHLDIGFDVSWSDVALYIDGSEVTSWSNSDKTIPYEFSPGTHTVRIEYHNNWHTTDFNTSFTSNSLYTKDEAMALIQPYIDPDTQIIYVGAYESGDLYNNSTVVLDGTADKVFLVLSSYDSFNWVIENPNNVAITGIAFGSYSDVSTVTVDGTVPTFEIDGLAYGYQDFTAPSSDIEYLTGRLPDYTYGSYSLTEAFITVP